MLISEAFEMYRTDYIVFHNQSAKTEETHLLAMRSIIGFVGDIEIQNITFQVVRDWKTGLEKHMAHNTSRLYLIKLRNVLKFMKSLKVECLDVDLIKPPKREETTIDFLIPEEVVELIESIKSNPNYTKLNKLRNVAIVSLLYGSGIRVGELCRLNKNDIRVDDTFTVVGKRNKIRLCFIDERSKSAINAYLMERSDHNPALFINDIYKDRLTPGTVQFVFRYLSKIFGHNIHPHTMRHSFATDMLRNNTNLFYVAKLLGHESTQTTEMYTHYVDEDLRKIYQLNHTI